MVSQVTSPSSFLISVFITTEMELGKHLDSWKLGRHANACEAGTPRGCLLLPEWSSLSTGITAPVLTAFLHLQICDQVAMKAGDSRVLSRNHLEGNFSNCPSHPPLFVLSEPHILPGYALWPFSYPHLWNSLPSPSPVSSHQDLGF